MAVGVLVTGANEPGPAGSGTAWASNVRAVRVGGLTFFAGVGPFGAANSAPYPWGRTAVTEREWIRMSTVQQQFIICLENLFAAIKESGTGIGESNVRSDRALVNRTSCVRMIWLHLSDLSSLPQIDAIWSSFVSPHPLRSIYVHPIRGGAKVEIDALVGDFRVAVFRVIANGDRPGQYACVRQSEGFLFGETGFGDI